MLKSPKSDSERATFQSSSSPSKLLSPSKTTSHEPHPNKTSPAFIQSKILEDINNEDIVLDVEQTTAQEYFRQDSEENLEEDEETLKKRLHNRKDGNAHIADFKLLVFLKFFVMHILFFCCLGPLIIILTPIFGWKVLRNQDFTPRFTLGYLRQSMEFSIIVSFLVVFYMTDTPGLQAIEIYMLLVGVIVRMIIISSKYAHQSELFLKLVNSTILTDEDKSHDQMLAGWRLQTDAIITEELQSAILRLEIDSPLFFFNFLGEFKGDLRNKLTKKINENNLGNLELEEKKPQNLLALPHAKTTEQVKVTEVDSSKDSRNTKSRFNQRIRSMMRKNKKSKEKLGKEHKTNKTIDPSNKPNLTISKSATAISKLFMNFLKPQKLESKYLNGYNLAFDLRQNARAFKLKKLGITCLIFSLIRGLIPTLYRVYLLVYKEEDIPLLTTKPYIVIVAFILNSFLFWVNTFILSFAIQDFKTKVWCFKQIGFLICPRKIHEYKIRKLYPTLNIFDPVTLKTWSSLRKVMKEFGKKYMMRNNFNITVCMTVYSFILCTFILQMLGVFTAYNDPLILIIFGYESVVFFVIFISTLAGAAFLNNQYKFHKNLLKKNKNIISDFAKLSYLYVGKDAIKPDNMIYKQGLKVLRKELGNEDFENKLIARSEKLISMIDETIEELEFEEANDPFTVMGIKVDYNLLKSMAIGGISLVFALGQKLVNK